MIIDGPRRRFKEFDALAGVDLPVGTLSDTGRHLPSRARQDAWRPILYSGDETALSKFKFPLHSVEGGPFLDQDGHLFVRVGSTKRTDYSPIDVSDMLSLLLSNRRPPAAETMLHDFYVGPAEPLLVRLDTPGVGVLVRTDHGAYYDWATKAATPDTAEIVRPRRVFTLRDTHKVPYWRLLYDFPAELGRFAQQFVTRSEVRILFYWLALYGSVVTDAELMDNIDMLADEVGVSWSSWRAGCSRSFNDPMPRLSYLGTRLPVIGDGILRADEQINGKAAFDATDDEPKHFRTLTDHRFLFGTPKRLLYAVIRYVVLKNLNAIAEKLDPWLRTWMGLFEYAPRIAVSPWLFVVISSAFRDFASKSAAHYCGPRYPHARDLLVSAGIALADAETLLSFPALLLELEPFRGIVEVLLSNSPKRDVSMSRSIYQAFHRTHEHKFIRINGDMPGDVAVRLHTSEFLGIQPLLDMAALRGYVIGNQTKEG